MEIKIEWSKLSEDQLKAIYDYYSLEANPLIAKRIVDKIIARIEILYKNPLAGAKEELLADYPEIFRFLVEGNYKIIYWKEKELITIAAVFDSRQNPEKMKKI